MAERQTEHMKPHYVPHIVRAMEYHFPGAKVILFGSRARLEHREGADIDLAVDAGAKVDFGELLRARITLENLPIPVFIDLIDLQSVSAEQREHIRQQGVDMKTLLQAVGK